MVPPGDPRALAGALDSLLDDPEARQRMGEMGRLRARQFEAAAVDPTHRRGLRGGVAPACRGCTTAGEINPGKICPSGLHC